MEKDVHEEIKERVKNAQYELKLAYDYLNYMPEKDESVPEIVCNDEAPSNNITDIMQKNRKLINTLIWQKGKLTDQAFRKLCDFAYTHMGFNYREHKEGVRKYVSNNQKVLTLEKQKILLKILEGRA